MAKNIITRALGRLAVSVMGNPSAAGQAPAQPALVQPHEDAQVAQAIQDMQAAHAPSEPQVPQHLAHFGSMHLEPITRTEDQTSPHNWYALAGNRIELGSTGFVIQLLTTPGAATFNLYDPEGRLQATSQLLDPLKRWAEKLASWRDEFSCLPAGWKY